MSRWTFAFVALLLAATTLPMLNSTDLGLYANNTDVDVITTAHHGIAPINP